MTSFPLKTAKWFPKNMLKQTERISAETGLGANNVLMKETRLSPVDM